MLGVEIDKTLSRLTQRCQGHGEIIDPCLGPPPIGHLSTENDLIILHLKADHRHELFPSHRTHLKDGGDSCRISPTPDKARPGPCAGHQVEGVEQETLSSPRLTRNDG